MVTSVEEDSSFPLPTRTHYGALLGGSHMLQGLCGEAEPQQKSAMAATQCVLPTKSSCIACTTSQKIRYIGKAGG